MKTKLDEILENYRKEIVRTEFIPIDEKIDSDVENAYREQLKRQIDEEAKQQISELIDEERGKIIRIKIDEDKILEKFWKQVMFCSPSVIKNDDIGVVSDDNIRWLIEDLINEILGQMTEEQREKKKELV